MLGEPDGDVARPLLTLGRIDLLRIQVGYRAWPDGPAHQQFLLDLAVPEAHPSGRSGALDELQVLTLLEPVLHGDDVAGRHYSLHSHRWHTSWGLSPCTLEIGLLVTAGSPASASSGGWRAAVARAFESLLEQAGRAAHEETSRDAAILRARHGAATAFGLDAGTLSLSAEEHHPETNSWSLGLRTTSGHEYDALVGLVDGYERSVWLRHRRRVEVFDSVGSV